MEYRVRPTKLDSPRHLSGYFDTFVQSTQTLQDPSTRLTMLSCLKSQKEYLYNLLGKTATTLNALRDKQCRNDRLLSTNLGPRSKKKKILQNRWRTDKTIKTCENEEKVILDCLQVCENNIDTLELIIYPTGTPTTTAEYNSSNSKCSFTDSATTDFDWNGWADEWPMSLFHKPRQHALTLENIPPEAHVHGTALGNPITARKASVPKRPPPLSPRIYAPPSAKLPPVPPNTALPQHHYSVLSPEATSFEPRIKRTQKEVDKLSISGLLASTHMSQILGQCFSDAADGHIFQRLPVNNRPGVGTEREHKSWGPDSRQYHASVSNAAAATSVKRTWSA